MYVPNTKSRNKIIQVKQFQKFGFQIHVHSAVFGVPLYSHGTNTKYRNELMKSDREKTKYLAKQSISKSMPAQNRTLC